MLEIGINTNNECGESLEEIITNIKNAKFKNIMLSFKSGDLQESIKKINEQGLNIVYYHISNKNSNFLWAKGNTAEEYVKSSIEQLNICGKFKIPLAVFHSSKGNPGGDLPLKPNKQGLKNFKKILDCAKKNNIKIAIENIDKFGLKNTYYLLNKIKDDSLGFCFDAGHCELYTSNINLIKKFKKRLFAVHLHDNQKDWIKGYDHTKDKHLLPFDGKGNYIKICKDLKKINYKGIIMLEVHKKPFSNSEQYNNLTSSEFLNEAYDRALRIRDLVSR